MSLYDTKTCFNFRDNTIDYMQTFKKSNVDFEMYLKNRDWVVEIRECLEKSEVKRNVYVEKRRDVKSEKFV